jgi:hypothetical protein
VSNATHVHHDRGGTERHLRIEHERAECVVSPTAQRRERVHGAHASVASNDLCDEAAQRNAHRLESVDLIAHADLAELVRAPAPQGTRLVDAAGEEISGNDAIELQCRR